MLVVTVVALSSCTMCSEGATTAKPAAAQTASSSSTSSSGASSSSQPDDVQGQSYAPSPTSTVPRSERDVPEGMQRVSDENLRVSFVVPKGWTVLTASTLKQQTTLDKIKPLATRQKKSPQQFAAEVTKDSAVLAADLSGDLSHGGGPTVVLLKDTSEFMADEQSLGRAISGIGGTPGQFARDETSLGDAARMSYRITSNGVVWYGVELRIPNGVDSTSPASVRARSEKEATSLADTLLSSLRRS